MMLVPFAELRRGVIREYLHAMYSVKAMLHAAEQGAGSLSEKDLAGVFGDFLDRPDSELLSQFKSNVATAAGAAALVFMHSAYENAVFDLIKRLVEYDPESWAHFVDKKEVPFETVRASSVSEIRAPLLEDWLKKAEKESFPWKVQKVFEVLKPQNTTNIIPGFEYKRDDLRKIDALRHEMTHRPKFACPIPDVLSKLKYLHNTVLMLEKLAEQKYPGKASGG